MEACQDFKEKLILDAHGELDQTERFALEGHLRRCATCRRERERLVHLLDQIKEAVPAPELTPAQASELTGFISKKVREKKVKNWWQKWDVTGGHRLIPALAAACLIIVALGWFSLKGLKHSPSPQPLLSQNGEVSLITEDMEIIENLEFLEEMDILDKLVERVDNRNVL